MALHRQNRRMCMKRVLVVAAMALLPFAAAAQDSFPSKPIRLIVPYGPGGVSDTVGRIVANGLGKAMNANVFVENHGGAGGAPGGNNTPQTAPAGATNPPPHPPQAPG